MAAVYFIHAYFCLFLQKGMLDISLRFSDSTEMPLDYISRADYFLDMVTLNNHVVTFSTNHSGGGAGASGYQYVGANVGSSAPQIQALSEGKGELLKVSLELGDHCRRKKSRIMAVAYVNVDVDFSHPGYDVLGDASYHGNDGDIGGWLFGKGQGSDSQKMPSGPGADRQRPIRDQHDMTSLEIGMYVLLGVFCVAMAVFLVNCAVFVMRYKKKHVSATGGGVGGGVSKRGSVTNANDWVWIGRQTLQRNAIQTDCQQALMSQHDFSVNKTVAKFLLPQSNPSSNRSSTCAMGTSAISAGGGVGGSNGAPSNRNSIVSTYKGSECSIRITPNPLQPLPQAGDGGASTIPRQRYASLGRMARPPMHTFHGPAPTAPKTLPRRHTYANHAPVHTNGALSDIQSASALSLTSSSSDEQNCSSFSSSLLHAAAHHPDYAQVSRSSTASAERRSRAPTPAQQARLAQVAHGLAQQAPLVEQQALLAQAAAQIAEQRHEDAANGNITDASSAEWDYDAMGMTYDELMEYFDNLKESSA